MGTKAIRLPGLAHVKPLSAEARAKEKARVREAVGRLGEADDLMTWDEAANDGCGVIGYYRVTAYLQELATEGLIRVVRQEPYLRVYGPANS